MISIERLREVRLNSSELASILTDGLTNEVQMMTAVMVIILIFRISIINVLEIGWTIISFYVFR